MNCSNVRISLDIHKNCSGAVVCAKRGDVGRRIHISLTDGCIPYRIGADCRAVFTAEKPDKNVIYNDCIIQGDTIIYDMTEQTTAVLGRVDCEIKLYGGDGKLITSPGFILIVSDTVYDDGDEVESTSEFSALTAAMAEVADLKKNGLKGDKGPSAYEVAVTNGFEGTEQEWLESLRGPMGPEGPTGKPLTVTITSVDGVLTADKMFAEMYQAYVDGRAVVCKIGDRLMPLVSAANSTMVFQSELEKEFRRITIKPDSTVTYTSGKYAMTAELGDLKTAVEAAMQTAEDAEQRAEYAAEASKTFYVHIAPSENGYSADKSFPYIREAYLADKPVVCWATGIGEQTGLMLPLRKCDDTAAYFSTVFEGKEYLVTISQDDAGNTVTTVEQSEVGSGGNVDQSGGMSTTAKALLITILRNGVYSTDQSANITALETALGVSGGEEEPDVPDEPAVTTYDITAELVHVTSNNSATSVNENASYTATLTAVDGYKLDSVTVIMGGVDVTADVYADGIITIAAVTDNVEIIAIAVQTETTDAILPENGLLAYFDLRNVTPETIGTAPGMKATRGEGALYHWGSSFLTETGNYGSKLSRGAMYSQDGNTTQSDLGTEFTVIQLSFGEAIGSGGVVGSNISPRWGISPSYNTADGTVSVEAISGSSLNNDSVADYNFNAYRVNGNALTVVMDTSRADFDGADYDGFVSWLSLLTVGKTTYGEGYGTAVVIYNRALTDVEIEEVRAFMKTLEVTA